MTTATRRRYAEAMPRSPLSPMVRDRADRDGEPDPGVPVVPGDGGQPMQAARADQHWTIFDLDRTITRTGTYSPFLLYAARTVAPWRLATVPAVLLAMIAYRARLLRRRTLKDVMQRLLLGATDRATITRLAQGFAERTLRSNLNRDALDRIAAERADGRMLILATAAHRFYADAIADRLGIEHVVATESHWQADTLLPRIRGENCHGREKATALSIYLESLGVCRSRLRLRLFSDDVSDLPSFEMCDEPVAVNPSAALRRLANVRGWPILRFY